jgi:uncharacterized protein YydD (DUF2326 family)
MLKLVKLYSNDKNLFPDIKFHDGLNVVFANVTKSNRDKSSHSLGKTTLIDVLNFALLKQIDKSSFLKKSPFRSLVIFLEIEYSLGQFVTIKRAVGGKISILKTSASSDIRALLSEDWEESNLGLKKAKSILNSILNLSPFDANHFHYRTGLRYCFRKQSQYEDTFKVNTSRETDANWKPYLANLLGINPQLVFDKYEQNQIVKSIESAITQVQELPTESAQSLEAEIAQIEARIHRQQQDLENFDFRNADAEVSSELVEQVSANLSDLNSEVYGIDQRIREINSSIGTEFPFDLDKIIELFDEVKINFPDQLSRSYKDLINLNQQMSQGRRERLNEARKKLINNRLELEKRIEVVALEQKALAEILVQKDAFTKYKLMQTRVSREESRIAVLRERVSTLDQASLLNEKLQVAKTKQSMAERELAKATRVSDNSKMKKALTIFSELVEDVLGLSAFFYTEVNGEGNLNFKIGLKDQTSVNDGFSYKRTLSAIFDLVILVLHSNESFYRFTYHDGLLESLDDRVKLKLLDKMRKLAKEHNLQLIISVLDSDVPMLENESRVNFPESEIIRHLDDTGNSGRLFKMPPF